MKKLVLWSFLVLSIAACRNDASFSEQLDIDHDLIEKHLADNNINATFDPERLLYHDIEIAGEGEAPTISNIVEVRYKGYLLDGTVFDETTGGNTIKFSLDRVIEGWQLAIPLLKRGGKGTFYLPSGLAYGNASVGSIPSNSILAFDIELVDFNRSFEEQLAIDSTIIQMHIDSANVNAVYESSLDIYHDIQEAGTGGSPTSINIVKVKYKGYFLDGTVFDETEGDNTIEFALQGVIEGWQRAVPLLQKGGKGTFYLPSGLAYGFIGTTTIPTNANLAFDIELVDFQ